MIRFQIVASPYGVLGHGKKSIALDLKRPEGVKIFKELCKRADVLIEPFRPGVMEKLGIGPDVLMADNPGLIYARLTGYGQNGQLADKAGHDINYVAISGILSLLKRDGGNPGPPINLAADFAGGSLMCTLGIVMCLYERKSSGKGQVIDCSMVEGLAYLANWILRVDSSLRDLLNSGAHFYNVYRTKDGKYIAFGAIEPQFYDNILKGLNIDTTNMEQFGDYERKKKIFREVILQKTRDEWCKIFEKLDACATPVLDLNEVALYPHNHTRNTFNNLPDGTLVANPAPKLSRTPGNSKSYMPHHGEHTQSVLLSLGYTADHIEKLQADNIITTYKKSHV